jgi:hypothetical protein
VKSRILGVVLNAVDSSAPDYYYSYRYYPYSYGYGPQETGEPAQGGTSESMESISESTTRHQNDDDLQAL